MQKSNKPSNVAQTASIDKHKKSNRSCLNKDKLEEDEDEDEDEEEIDGFIEPKTSNKRFVHTCIQTL